MVWGLRWAGLLEGGGCCTRRLRTPVWEHSYLKQSVFEVVLQKSTPTQICQLVLHYYWFKASADRFVWELTFAKRR